MNGLQIKRKSYRWKNLSKKEINNIKNKFGIFPSEIKEYFAIDPFLSIVLTKQCTLKCAYCCEGGEGTHSSIIFHDIDILKKRIGEALELGVKKLRLTGGEPFLYPKFKDLLKALLELKKRYNFFLLINTNATVLITKDFIPLLKNLNAKLAVHLDAINEDTYIKINKTNKKIFSTLIKNIKLLSKNRLLHRFNVVISKYNIDEFDNLIAFANKMEINIKAFDVTEVPKQFVDKNKIYIPLDKFIKNLEKRASKKFFHPYALAFGTPVMFYDIDSILISVKYTKYGSRYSQDYCKTCPFFPCDEGLYDILYYPDDTIWACRWYRNKKILKKDFKQSLSTLFKTYKKSKWFIGNSFVE